MKTIVTSLILAGASFLGVQAQTFSFADMAKAGDKVEYARDTLNRTFPGLEIPGNGQTWDFLDLGNHTKDTFEFSDATSDPNAPTGATLYDGENYWEADAGNMYMFLPIADPGSGAINYQRVKLAELPLTMGSTVKDSSSQYIYLDPSIFGGTIPGVDSVRVDVHIVVTSTIDASGKLILQAATYNNTSRHTMNFKTYSSLWLYSNMTNSWSMMPGTEDESEHITYSWWSPELEWFIARISIDNGTATSTSIEFLDGQGPATGIAQRQKIYENRCYPNPAQGKLYVEVKDGEAREFPVYNMEGNLMKKFKVNPGLNELELEDFPAGVYFYELNPGQMERLMVL